jgi:hypothetical protein
MLEESEDGEACDTCKEGVLTSNAEPGIESNRKVPRLESYRVHFDTPAVMDTLLPHRICQLEYSKAHHHPNHTGNHIRIDRPLCKLFLCSTVHLPHHRLAPLDN